jgi:hypothetical protein
MSVKLTDAQLVMMSAAAQRKDCCLSAPSTIKGGSRLSQWSCAVRSSKEGPRNNERRSNDPSDALDLIALKALGIDGVRLGHTRFCFALFEW